MSELNNILEGCLKQDRASQARLYKLLAPRLLGLCRRYLPDHDEAEDALQDSFVKIFTSLRSYQGQGSFEGWARRIAVNTALTALRRKNRLVFERHTESVEEAGDDQEENDMGLLSTADIMSCMNALPLGYRTIINLFLVEEFSHREIAEKLHISESTSRSQYARARQSLMKLIRERAGSLLNHSATE